MRIPGVILTLGVLWLCGGCCHRGPSFVPVREGVYRSELSTTNRLSLPLTAESREFLLKFLKSGRNPILDKDATISDPEAPWRYGSLLELLSQPENLAVTNLVVGEKFEASPTFAPWFPEHAIRQIVDAHEDWPPTRQPYVFLDTWGRYWWFFYHQQKRLTHVMVTRALEKERTK